MSRNSTKTEELTKLVNVKDFESVAKDNLSQMIYDYYAGGACDEITVAANEAAYSQLCIKYHVLNDVSNRTIKTTVLGQEIDSPIIIGPTAFQGLACERGELATASAAKRTGTVFTLSTLANHSMEEIANEVGGHLWYQLYVYKDRDVSRKLVEKAEEFGYKALVVTVDSQFAGHRERDVRNSFCLPSNIRAANFEMIGALETTTYLKKQSNQETDIAGWNHCHSSVADMIHKLYDQSLSWKDIEWFRSITKLPVLIKGLIRADDAKRAEECGIDGIIVSNHGGRSLDTSPSTLSVLPEIVSSVSKKTDVLLDGGIRRGTDVLKAIALGAKAVMIGRPVLWGLASYGEEGVVKILHILNGEFDLAMAFAGCKSPAEISVDLIGKMA
jgi:4-hydroxymandelate oxidase